MLTANLERARVRPGARVLDLGCGGGRHAFSCAQSGAVVIALDTDLAALNTVQATVAAMEEAGEIAKDRAAAVAADALRLPFLDASFDVVIASEVLEHVRDDEAALAELVRVLAPGGVVVLTVPRAGPEALNWTLSRAYHEVEGGHIRIYRRSQLRERARRAGVVPFASHHAHGLHSPYWWLRCLVGVDNETNRLVAAYHRLLVHDIVAHPRWLAALERALNPLIGKSYVLYGEKPASAVTKGRDPSRSCVSDRVSDNARRRLTASHDVPGRSWRVEREQSAASIVALQGHSGLIAWTSGGRADPWNHLEAVMALIAAGRRREAERGLAWLASRQREHGAWHAGYASDGSVMEERLDTNGTAYVAPALLQHYSATTDLAFLEEAWPMARRALGFVLSCQRDDGTVSWSNAPRGSAGDFALLAACSSIYASLEAGRTLAGILGARWSELEQAARRLREAIIAERGFLPKDEYAMDWYYPVLSGALGREAGRARLSSRWHRFVVEGRGVLCRSDHRWVTSAETAECALACVAVGWPERAATLLSWARGHEREDGSFATGVVYPEGSEFPLGERTSYSAAAFVLAADALDARSGQATRVALLGAGPGGHGALRLATPAHSPTASSTRKLPTAMAESSTKRPEPNAAR